MTPARAVGALAGLVGGALVGLAAVAVHGWWWGLALAAVGSIAAVLALPRRWWTRLPFAVGWLVPLGFAITPRPEGDYLVAATPRGYLLIGLGLLVLVLAVATAPRMRATPRPSDGRGNGRRPGAVA